MKKLFPLLVLLFAIILNSCSTVPVTGRKQVSLLPESQLVAMSLTNYDEFLNTHKLSSDKTKTAMVKKTGTKISEAVSGFLHSVNKAELVKDYAWEFNLIQEDVPNAWCMPGGKVVVYSGILPFTKSEAGLAVVMGHEIAHAVAKHGNERMSQGMIIQFGGTALDLALSKKPDETKELFMLAYGVGAQVGVMLPYSRLHESEADKLGLIFMAMAGYNPNEAVKFWERMAAAGGAKPPELLSTHPSDETRINKIKEFLPEAMKYYKQN
jgi:predicted Zn-dependent protease